MKKLTVLICLVMLAGCVNPDRETEAATELCHRLAGVPSSFSVSVTADYPDIREKFSMDCRWDPAGSLKFEVTGPDPLDGIRGTVSGEQAQVRFDETVLAFPLMDGDRLSPLSGAYLVMQALQSGQIVSLRKDAEQYQLTLSCGYEEDAPSAEVWLDDRSVLSAEIAVRGRRVLMLTVADFSVSEQRSED